MTKDKSNYLESVGREVQLRIAGGHGYITGPDMDDVEGAYDTGFEHGAASERESLARILSAWMEANEHRNHPSCPICGEPASWVQDVEGSPSESLWCGTCMTHPLDHLERWQKEQP